MTNGNQTDGNQTDQTAGGSGLQQQQQQRKKGGKATDKNPNRRTRDEEEEEEEQGGHRFQNYGPRLISFFKGTPDGKIAIKSWLGWIERLGEKAGWDDDTKCLIAIGKLAGPALDFVEMEPALKSTSDWEHFKDRFIERFEIQKSRMHMHQELNSVEQNEDEDEASFAHRLRCAAAVLFPEESEMKEMTLHTLFCNKLRNPTIRQFVLNAKTTTIAEALKEAQDQRLNLVGKDKKRGFVLAIGDEGNEEHVAENRLDMIEKMVMKLAS